MIRVILILAGVVIFFGAVAFHAVRSVRKARRKTKVLKKRFQATVNLQGDQQSIRKKADEERKKLDETPDGDLADSANSLFSGGMSDKSDKS